MYEGLVDETRTIRRSLKSMSKLGISFNTKDR